jgi:hypothetical protein
MVEPVTTNSVFLFGLWLQNHRAGFMLRLDWVDKMNSRRSELHDVKQLRNPLNSTGKAREFLIKVVFMSAWFS